MRDLIRRWLGLPASDDAKAIHSELVAIRRLLARWDVTGVPKARVEEPE